MKVANNILIDRLFSDILTKVESKGYYKRVKNNGYITYFYRIVLSKQYLCNPTIDRRYQDRILNINFNSYNKTKAIIINGSYISSTLTIDINYYIGDNVSIKNNSILLHELVHFYQHISNNVMYMPNTRIRDTNIDVYKLNNKNEYTLIDYYLTDIEFYPHIVQYKYLKNNNYKLPPCYYRMVNILETNNYNKYKKFKGKI